MTRRTERINMLLRQEISQVLSWELKDPRLSGVVSVTKVETSNDLRHAKVFISVLGTREEKQGVMSGVNSATGFIRRELGDRLSLKHIPFLQFTLDESLEEAEHMFKLMDRLAFEAPSDGTAGREVPRDSIQ